MGDGGVSIRVWHTPSQVARENDDSWQHAVWLRHQKCSPPTFCLIPSVPLLKSSHLHHSAFPHARSSRSNNSSSTGTCLDGSTFMKITTWAVFFFFSFFPSTVCFYFASHCASLNFTYFIHFLFFFLGWYLLVSPVSCIALWVDHVILFNLAEKYTGEI